MTKSCDCKAGYASSTGVNFRVNCTLDEEICFPGAGESLCGIPSINGVYNRKGPNSETKLGFDVSDLLNFGILDPEPLTLKLVHTAPLKLRNPISIQSCDMMYGTTPCTSCTVCNGGKGFQFDCSEISVFQIGSLVDIKLPKVDQCIGLP